MWISSFPADSAVSSCRYFFSWYARLQMEFHCFCLFGIRASVALRSHFLDLPSHRVTTRPITSQAQPPHTPRYLSPSLPAPITPCASASPSTLARPASRPVRISKLRCSLEAVCRYVRKYNCCLMFHLCTTEHYISGPICIVSGHLCRSCDTEL